MPAPDTSYVILVREAREMVATGTGTPHVGHLQAQDSIIRGLLAAVAELQAALLARDVEAVLAPQDARVH